VPTPINTYFEYAQLSLAAYANLILDMNTNRTDYIDALKSAGFTDSLASEFVTNYSIAAETFIDSTSGLSATLFQRNGSAEKILAIRGTVLPELGGLIADGLIVVGEAASLNPQYMALELFYLQLIQQGKLRPNDVVTVTGHSLGGYLAQAFTVDHAVNVAHTYTYNTPGTGGIIVDALQRLGVGDTTIPSSLVTNISVRMGSPPPQNLVRKSGQQLTSI
jgi:hypothetical protein